MKPTPLKKPGKKPMEPGMKPSKAAGKGVKGNFMKKVMGKSY